MKMLEGQTALVTGANSGIGRAAALALAGRKASVWLLCRNEQPASVNLLNGGLHSGILWLRARYEFYKELGFCVKNQEVVGEVPASRESTLPHQWQE